MVHGVEHIHCKKLHSATGLSSTKSLWVLVSNQKASKEHLHLKDWLHIEKINWFHIEINYFPDSWRSRKWNKHYNSCCGHSPKGFWRPSIPDWLSDLARNLCIVRSFSNIWFLCRRQRKYFGNICINLGMCFIKCCEIQHSSKCFCALFCIAWANRKLELIKVWKYRVKNTELNTSWKRWKEFCRKL